MARRYRPPRPASAISRSWSPQQKLLLLGGLALLGGIGVATLDAFEQRVRVSEQVVTVYRVHGCTCVFSWVDALRAAGFSVQVVEHTSLAAVRSTLETPDSLHGCHVGRYLNYFVEGHVAPEALKSLAANHPIALGVTTEASVGAGRIHTSIADEEHSPVVLVEPDGKMLPWFDERPTNTSDGAHG